jgi:hypothetical protein
MSDAKPKLRQRIQAGRKEREDSNSPDAKAELNCLLATRGAGAERGFQAYLRMGATRRRRSRSCAILKFVRTIATSVIFLPNKNAEEERSVPVCGKSAYRRGSVVRSSAYNRLRQALFMQAVNA